MLRHHHVTTYGITEYDWLSDLSDLDLLEVGGKPILLAATQYRGGGVSSYSFGGRNPQLRQVDTSPYPDSSTYQLEPVIERLDIAGQNFAYLSRLGNAQHLGLAIAADGTLGGFVGVLPMREFERPVTALTAAGTVTGGYVYSAHPDEPGLNAHRVDGVGAATNIGQTLIDLPQAHEFATIDKIIETQSGGQKFLVSISGLGDFIAVHRLNDNGGLQQVALHTGSFGVGYAIPQDVVAAQAGDRSLLVLSGAASSSLTVFELLPDGGLVAIDHILDEETTRFENTTALATATIGDRTFVFAGGTDGGISVLMLQPDGRFLHLTTLTDTEETTLTDITDIATYVANGSITVFVASATETGITQFEFNPGKLGHFTITQRKEFIGTTLNDLLVAGPGTTTLNGGEGDDILIAGPDQISLIGGGGQDVFVLSQNGETNWIRNFEPGKDSLDLSQLENIHSPDQLRLNVKDGRIVVQIKDTRYIVLFDKGEDFSAAHFTHDLFAIRHYPPPPVPQIPTGPQPVSAIGEHIFGTSEADSLIGGIGPDIFWTREGDDTVTGDAGNDTVFGMDGDDELSGGSGADSIRGGNGRDTIRGGPDGDYLHGGAQADRILGGTGRDILDGAGGNDTLSGEAGNDRILGGSGADILRGGPGNDDLIGGPGNDVISGTGGQNRLRGMTGNDRVIGGNGRDFMDGGSGHDRLSGGRGDDQILGGPGNDTIVGGAGMDWLRGGSGADVFVFNPGDSDPATKDRIYDFQPGTDLLDLSALDLHYTGKARFSGPGELRWETRGNSTRIDADIDGDGRSDLRITLDGRPQLSPEDFLF